MSNLLTFYSPETILINKKEPTQPYIILGSYKMPLKGLCFDLRGVWDRNNPNFVTGATLSEIRANYEVYLTPLTNAQQEIRVAAIVENTIIDTLLGISNEKR